MEKIIGACGLVCSECEAYKATQANDVEALQKVVDKWKVEYQWDGFTVTNILCDSCMGPSERRVGHCSQCDMRRCALGKGIESCAECPDYESCQRIADFFKFVPSAKVVLDEVRAGR